MLTITHILTAGLITAATLQSSEPEIILLGAISGMLPDADLSSTPAGRILFPLSRWIEKRYPHRTVTHSILASFIVAIIAFSFSWLLSRWIPINWNYPIAILIGYSAGWFIDIFTKSGVEMFYPIRVRCVCPGNRNLRFSTGSTAEYWLLVFLAAIFVGILQLNTNGGIMQTFNKIIAIPSGVESVFNQVGSSNEVKACVDGVFTIDRRQVNKCFPIISSNGKGFLVEDGKAIYKISNEPDANIIPSRITAEVGKSIIVKIETMNFDDQLFTVSQDDDKIFLSGLLETDTPEDINIEFSPEEWQTLKVSENSVTLSECPLEIALVALNGQYVTGTISIRKILGE
jgi:inner membrane protein